MVATCRITNPMQSQTVAFSIRPKLVRADSGDQVLPVFMNAGYFSLLPGESREIRMEYQAVHAGEGAPKLVVECWNNSSPTAETSPSPVAP